MAQKFTFVSGKGGVGKSSIALGLARNLSERGLKVMIADFDIGLRSLDAMLGVSETIVFDWGDVILGRCDAKDAAIEIGTLTFFAAPFDFEDEFTPETLGEFFSSIEKNFDVMLFDAPAGLGRAFRLAASLADKSILVTTPDTVCVRSCATAATQLRRRGYEDLRLIINRFQEKPVLKSRLLNIDDCIDAVKVRLFGIVPEDEEVVESSVVGQAPGRTAPSARAIDRISRRILGEKVPLFRD